MINIQVLKFGSLGPMVEYLQSILKRLGFYTTKIDGIFGLETQRAVNAMQKDFGIPADGIVGQQTYLALSPYLRGYTNYKISSGDTFFSLAKRFQTSIARIRFANLGINESNLKVGQMIRIPFGEIVPTNISYSSTILNLNLNALVHLYPFLQKGTIGKSVLGKDIPFIRIGNGKKEVFYNASFHANEWITSVLLMKFIENFSQAYVEDTTIFGRSAKELFASTSLYIVPMVNQDGVDLVTGEILPYTSTYQKAKAIANNYPKIPFPYGWKANIHGIDLNLQYPAGWEEAKKIKAEQGFTTPAPRDFVGFGPLTAPEALAVYNFTLSHSFQLVLAYHTQGEVIYWQFLDFNPPQAKEIGQAFSKVSGYLLDTTPYSSSFAGYKDWFIQQYNLPGYTVEAGLGVNPLPISQFASIYQDNEGILVLGMVL